MSTKNTVISGFFAIAAAITGAYFSNVFTSNKYEEKIEKEYTPIKQIGQKYVDKTQYNDTFNQLEKLKQDCQKMSSGNLECQKYLDSLKAEHEALKERLLIIQEKYDRFKPADENFVQTITHNKYFFELSPGRKEGKDIVIDFQVTNRGDDRIFGVYKIHLITPEGEEIAANKGFIGGTTKIWNKKLMDHTRNFKGQIFFPISSQKKPIKIDLKIHLDGETAPFIVEDVPMKY